MPPYMLVVLMRRYLILYYGNCFFKLDLSVSTVFTFSVSFTLWLCTMLHNFGFIILSYGLN